MVFLPPIQNLFEKLKKNPEILGLLVYGSYALGAADESSDLDLIVVTEFPSRYIESIHTFIENTPADINFRSISYLERIANKKYIDDLSVWDWIILRAKIIYDREEKIKPLASKIKSLSKKPGPSKREVARLRFTSSHFLNNLESRFDKEPLLTEVYLASKTTWLLRNYCLSRNILFEGERKTLKYLEENDPDFLAKLEQFFQAKNLEEKYGRMKKLMELVLEPIGGLWEKNEILALAKEGVDLEKSKINLQEEGKNYWEKLLEG